MDIIRRKHLRNGWMKRGARRRYIEREYKVYRREEADEQDIQYVDWRTVEPGQWGLTDDGWVGECTNRRQYQKKDNIVFSFGQFWYNPNTKYGKCEYGPRRESGSYGATTTKHPWETYKGRQNYKNFVKVYVAQLLGGRVDYTILGKVFGDSENHDIKARALLKKEYVKDMVDKELRDVFTEKNVDEGTVVDMIQSAHDIAKEKRDPSNMLRAAENFAKFLNMDGKKDTRDNFDAELSSLERIENAMELNPAQDVSDVANGKKLLSN